MAILFIVMILFTMSLPVFADGETTTTDGKTSIENSKLFTGTKSMINDATSALNKILPIAIGLLLAASFAIKAWMDEIDAPKWQKRIKIAIGCLIGALLANVIVSVVTYYYG